MSFIKSKLKGDKTKVFVHSFSGPIFSVQSTSAAVTVTVSEDADVYLGESAILRCQYSGVTDTSLIMVKWEYRADGEKKGHGIWTYEGIDDLDTWHRNDGKFERMETDVSKEHTIRLNDAGLEDEGNYFCNVEYYNGDGYLEETAKTMITVIGTHIHLLT